MSSKFSLSRAPLTATAWSSFPLPSALQSWFGPVPLVLHSLTSEQVKLQYIAVTAAVSTVIAMLHKPETTSAAITMLGKTVELCAPVLKERCDPNKLNELRTALLKVTASSSSRLTCVEITDDIFRYDITYIEENLAFNRAGALAPAPALAHPGQFVCLLGSCTFSFGSRASCGRSGYVSDARSCSSRVLRWAQEHCLCDGIRRAQRRHH